MSKQNILESWINWGIDLALEITKGLEDKKFTVWEGIALTDNALKLPGLIRRSKEFQDLEITEQLRKELSAKFNEKFDLPNEQIETLIELCIDGVLFNAGLGIKIAKLMQKDDKALTI